MKRFIEIFGLLPVNHCKWFLGVLCVCCWGGCSGFRFAATEAQKENAWRHERVCTAASGRAVDEQASEALRGLTALASEQSRAFAADYGLPREVPPAEDVETMLASGGAVATAARADSVKRPDVWTLADSAMELGIALAGLVGGVYGVRAAGYLKTAREKSKALKEIVEGNELFKQLCPEQAARLKEAQANQSAATKRWVADVKVNRQ